MSNNLYILHAQTVVYPPSPPSIPAPTPANLDQAPSHPLTLSNHNNNLPRRNPTPLNRKRLLHPL